MLGYLEAQSWWRHQMETFSASLAFVRGIHRGPLMFALICVWINGWANNREAGDLIRHRAHYDVIVIWYSSPDPFMHWATYRQRFIYQLWHGCVIKPHSMLWDMLIHRGPNFNDALEKLSSLPKSCIWRHVMLNTFRSRQHRRDFADVIFMYIFLN